jgi:hypothetical protein
MPVQVVVINNMNGKVISLIIEFIEFIIIEFY